MQNEPKLYNPHIILTTYPERTYNNFCFSGLPENEPKRTQNEPKVKIGKIAPNPLFQKVLYQFLPLRTYKNEPKRTQNEPNSKGQFPKKNPLSAQKIHPQTPNAPLDGRYGVFQLTRIAIFTIIKAQSYFGFAQISLKKE